MAGRIQWLSDGDLVSAAGALGGLYSCPASPFHCPLFPCRDALRARCSGEPDPLAQCGFQRLRRTSANLGRARIQTPRSGLPDRNHEIEHFLNFRPSDFFIIILSGFCPSSSPRYNRGRGRGPVLLFEKVDLGPADRHAACNASSCESSLSWQGR